MIRKGSWFPGNWRARSVSVTGHETSSSHANIRVTWNETSGVSGKDALRVVILGKTGSGKSSLGNTLLGREAFRVTTGMGSGTPKCQWADAELPDMMLEEVVQEVAKSVALCLPGPHVILMVLRSDRRFTAEEHDAYQTLKKLFGEEIRQHMIIVFTAIDIFREESVDGQRTALKAQIDGPKCPPQLRQVLDDADGRYFGVNNLVARQPGDSQTQRLIHMMKELRTRNNGRFYNSKIIQDIGTALDPLVQQTMQTTNTSRQEAVRQVNTAIVTDSGEPSVMQRITAVIADKIKKLEAAGCSVM
ncbi:hypothetical protein BaRGS_00022691 [Batillaria attramentaria]|uniref:AIG1-type G domain-containing protein n=1 Tax=Batillaria attramentaria TaxID=370345 RepID=A0ABD0KGR6_9CAEN